MTARPAWTLRRRLVVAFSALIVVMSLLIGLVSVVALRGYLVDKLDTQLTEAVARLGYVIDKTPHQGEDTGGKPEQALPLAGLEPGSIAAVISGTTISAAILGAQLDTNKLTGAQADAFLSVPSDGTEVTIDLEQLGEYRVAATETYSGDTVLVGLPMSGVTETVARLVLVIALLTLSGLFLVVAAGTAIVRFALRPLDRVAATAAHVAELPLDRGEVALAVRVSEEDARPDTEVGQVGAALNRMLEHVAGALTAREASERKVRTFVADASHELRTPLASIRGYSELTRRSGHQLPEDIVRALGRIESESLRMTSLVEDLLLLARLDDGRELESRPVDLGALLSDTVSDAHAAGQDHDWRIELPDEPIVVPGDAARLHQVLANLLANARTHTPAGTTVTASLAAVGTHAVIEVRDDGPGIAMDLQPTLFERFVRGDGSRSRAAGSSSTGLGLAIVTAVVEAHDGTVAVRSAPGDTVFTVTLPRS